MSSLGVSQLNFQDTAEIAKNFATGFGGKLIGSIAGILLIITVLKHTFYLVRVGQRAVLLRGGLPVLKKNGETLRRLSLVCSVLRLWRLAALFADLSTWRKSRQIGIYKVKRPGRIGMKIPGWHEVEKVNVQNRVQQLAAFNADCKDGQRHVNAQFITRVPCDDDGPEYADYPARTIIYSSEADDMFESDGGTALLNILESAEAENRNNERWLRDEVNEQVGDEFDRCGYLLLRVNLRARALTPIQKAIDAFAPKPAEPESEETKERENDNVRTLPHPLVMTTALTDVANSS